MVGVLGPEKKQKMRVGKEGGPGIWVRKKERRSKQVNFTLIVVSCSTDVTLNRPPMACVSGKSSGVVVSVS